MLLHITNEKSEVQSEILERAWILQAHSLNAGSITY